MLVDSLGLARFRPSLRFALGFLRFTSRPSERSFERFMDQCAEDRQRLQQQMGNDWTAFVAHNLSLARSDKAKPAGQLFRRAGTPRIPPDKPQQITVPVTLVWGRNDRALPLRIAERASAQYGWPLHVIEDAADDPARDQPEAFLRALRSALPETWAEPRIDSAAADVLDIRSRKTTAEKVLADQHRHMAGRSIRKLRPG